MMRAWIPTYLAIRGCTAVGMVAWGSGAAGSASMRCPGAEPATIAAAPLVRLRQLTPSPCASLHCCRCRRCGQPSGQPHGLLSTSGCCCQTHGPSYKVQLVAAAPAAGGVPGRLLPRLTIPTYPAATGAASVCSWAEMRRGPAQRSALEERAPTQSSYSLHHLQRRCQPTKCVVLFGGAVCRGGVWVHWQQAANIR